MEKQVDGMEKKRVIVSSVLIILLVVLVLGFTYAVFSYKGFGTKKNTIRTGELTFSYTEVSDGISLTDAVPMSDEVGKKMQGNDKENRYFDFSVSCKMSSRQNVQYEIYSTEVDVDQKLDSQYVKMYLTDSTTELPLDGYDKKVPVYSELKDSNISNNAKRLYVGKFSSSGVQSFRLRMWLSDSYQISSSSKKFKIKVNVSASS